MTNQAILVKRWVVAAAVTFAVFAAYRTVVAPHLAPQTQVGHAGSLGSSQGSSQDDEVAALDDLLPADGWERTSTKRLTTSHGRMFFQSYTTSETGELEVRPLTLIVPIESRPSASPRSPTTVGTIPASPRLALDPVPTADASPPLGPTPKRYLVLRATDGAALTFDGGLDLTSGRIGQLTGGRLLGRVEMFVPESAPGQGDRWTIVTSNVQIDPTRIATPAAVELRFAGSEILGRDLEITLEDGDLDDSRTTQADSLGWAARVNTLTLGHIDRCEIELADAGRLPRPDDARPTASGSKLEGRLSLTAQGAFTLDLRQQLAKLEDHVQLEHYVGQEIPDRMSCSLVEINFALASSPAATGDRPGASPADQPSPSTAPAAARWRIDQLVAVGNPVILRSDKRGLRAQAERIEYNFPRRTIRMIAEYRARLDQDGTRLEAKQLEYRLPPPDAPPTERIGDAVLIGPGSVVHSDRASATPPWHVKWQQRMEFRRRDGLYVLTCDGGVTATAVPGEATAGWLTLWLRPDSEASASRGPGSSAPWADRRPGAATPDTPPGEGWRYQPLTPPSLEPASPGGDRFASRDLPTGLAPIGPTGGLGSETGSSPVETLRALGGGPIRRPETTPLARPTEPLMPKMPRLVPISLLAKQGVDVQTAQLHLQTEQVQVWIEESATPIARSDKGNPLGGMGQGSDLPLHRITGDEINVRLARHGDQVELRDVVVNGKFQVFPASDGFARKPVDVLAPLPAALAGASVGESASRLIRAGGTGLHWIWHPDDLHELRIDGAKADQPAYFASDGLSVAGQYLVVDQVSNLISVEGGGNITVPVGGLDSAFGGVASGQSANRSSSRTPADADATKPLTIAWSRRMKLRERTLRFDGDVELTTDTEKAEGPVLVVTLDRPLDLRNVADLKTRPELSELQFPGGVFLNRRVLEQGVLQAVEKLRAPTLTVDALRQRMSTTGPVSILTIRRQADTGTPGGAAGLLSHTQPTAETSPRGDQLKYLSATAAKGLTVDLRASEAVLDQDVTVLMADVAHWETWIEPMRPDRVPAGVVVLRSDKLTASQESVGPARVGPGGTVRGDEPGGSSSRTGDAGLLGVGDRSFALEATGRTSLLTREGTATGGRLSYSQSKDLVVLEGDPRADAILEKYGDERSAGSRLTTRKILYWRSEGRFQVDGLSGFDHQGTPLPPSPRDVARPRG